MWVIVVYPLTSCEKHNKDDDDCCFLCKQILLHSFVAAVINRNHSIIFINHNFNQTLQMVPPYRFFTNSLALVLIEFARV